MSSEHEAERTLARDDVATALRRLADGVATGSVSVDAEEGPVAVDVPTDLTFEVELEESDDEVELEVELEWETDESDGSAIRELGQDDGSVGDSAAAAADDSIESPAGDDDESVGDDTVETDLVGPADESGSKARFELFRDAADEWRWRLRHRNGNVIADSGEGYDRKSGAMNGLESVKSNAPLAVVEEASDE